MCPALFAVTESRSYSAVAVYDIRSEPCVGSVGRPVVSASLQPTARCCLNMKRLQREIPLFCVALNAASVSTIGTTTFASTSVVIVTEDGSQTCVMF
jgi:hypothetical protein